MQKLNVHHAKHKDELVEYEIPEFIFQVLLLRNAKFTEN